ncbi:MAG: GNAT family N-acetyltransferase [Kaistia sp. SCN 65-12]|nr:MAG: GNAT family N-acetyltransferase [Kaistia sp. SCN 65-12]
MPLPTEGEFRLRRADLADMPAVYRVCLKTGDAGKDATAREDDPDALGHMFIGPYLVLEPRFAFVLDGPSGVAGYIMGALDTPVFYARMERDWLSALRRRIPDPGQDESRWTGSDWVRHRIHHPPYPYPAALHAFPSHGHIDFLAEARGQGWGKRGFRHLMDALAEAGSPGMHLDVHPDNASAIAFYEKLGFAPVLSDELPAGSLTMARRF